MRVYYHLSEYISHRLTGLDFADCLRRLGHEVSHDPASLEEAGAAILHEHPERYPGLFGRMPRLRGLRTIAYCVWETEILPEEYKGPLGLVREIWTPSEFSRRGMLPHFPHARVLPHVVRRLPASRRDLERMGRLLDGKGGGCVFFSVVDAINPRKNVPGLLTAFALARKRRGRGIRLVLKQYRRELDFSSLPGVISIGDDLGDGEMAALHILSNAYVSAHHAEGWGLGLSQAMAYGKPVIATGYSGNMDYMDADNSFPVPYRMVSVSGAMHEKIPLFTPDMQWAEVDVEAFAACMCRVAEGRVPPGMAERAAGICERFGPERVSALMRELLDNPPR